MSIYYAIRSGKKSKSGKKNERGEWRNARKKAKVLTKEIGIKRDSSLTAKKDNFTRSTSVTLLPSIFLGRGCYSSHRRKLHRLTVESSVPAIKLTLEKQEKRRESWPLHLLPFLLLSPPLFLLQFYSLERRFISFVSVSIYFRETRFICAPENETVRSQILRPFIGVFRRNMGFDASSGKVNAIERGFNDFCQSVEMMDYTRVEFSPRWNYFHRLISISNIFFFLFLLLRTFAIDQLLIINDIGRRLVKIVGDCKICKLILSWRASILRSSLQRYYIFGNGLLPRQHSSFFQVKHERHKFIPSESQPIIWFITQSYAFLFSTIFPPLEIAVSSRSLLSSESSFILFFVLHHFPSLFPCELGSSNKVPWKLIGFEPFAKNTRRIVSIENKIEQSRILVTCARLNLHVARYRRFEN